jgi:hypothetical protein
MGRSLVFQIPMMNCKVATTMMALAWGGLMLVIWWSGNMFKFTKMFDKNTHAIGIFNMYLLLVVIDDLVG